MLKIIFSLLIFFSLTNYSYSASGSSDGGSKSNYNKASKIAMQWIKNYTEFNFRSLGSYTRKELNDIANNSDAL